MDRAGTLRDGEALVVAHRGSWDAATPQNSLAALEAAISLGCDMVEVDVRRTRDGKLVVVHDVRVAGVAVAALDHVQLLERVGPGQAPLLADLLERASERIRLDLELKEDGFVAEVIEAIERARPPAGSVLTSFLPAVLATARRLAPETRTGLLLRPMQRARTIERRVLESTADFLAPHASLARTGVLTWAVDRGFETYLWTVNDTRILRSLLADLRVTAIITDRPARALALRTEARPISALA